MKRLYEGISPTAGTGVVLAGPKPKAAFAKYLFARVTGSRIPDDVGANLAEKVVTDLLQS